MSALSPELEERARKNRAMIFAGLSSAGQAEVARALQISESTVSKMKGDEIEKVSQLLAVVGLKVVPIAYRCVEPKKMEALLTLAGVELDRLRERPELVWEGEG